MLDGLDAGDGTGNSSGAGSGTASEVTTTTAVGTVPLVVEDGLHGKPWLELEPDGGLRRLDVFCSFKFGSGTPCLFNIGVKSGRHGGDKGVFLEVVKGKVEGVENNDENFIKISVILTPGIGVDGVPAAGFTVEDWTVPHGKLDKVLNELEFVA